MMFENALEDWLMIILWAFVVILGYFALKGYLNLKERDREKVRNFKLQNKDLVDYVKKRKLENCRKDEIEENIQK